MPTTETTARDLIARAATAGLDIAAEITAITGTTVRTIEEITSGWKPELRTPQRLTAKRADQLLTLVQLFNRHQAEELEARIGSRQSAPAPAGWSAAGTAAGHGHGVCDNCGGRGAAHRRIDSSGIAGRVCGRCVSADQHELSFA